MAEGPETPKTGGQEAPKAGEGGNPLAPANSAPQTFKLKVDGEEKVVTQDELVKLAQLGSSSTKRFQEASQMMTESQKAVQTVRALKNLEKGFDEVSFREAAEGLGLDESQVNQVIDSFREQKAISRPTTTNPPTNVPPTGQVSRPEIPREVEYKDLSRPMREFLSQIATEKMRGEVQNLLANDKVIGYHIRNNPDKVAAWTDYATEVVSRRVRETGQDYGVHKAQILEHAAGEVRKMFESFGNLKRPTPPPGLGPAPTGTPPEEHYPTKRPERVKSTEAGYDDYMTKLLQHYAVQAATAGS